MWDAVTVGVSVSVTHDKIIKTLCDINEWLCDTENLHFLSLFDR